MAAPRSPRFPAGGTTSPYQLAVVVLVAGLLLGLTLPSGAFSLFEATRSGTVGVAGDASAELGLNVYACLDKDNVDPLVDVTNNFEEPLSVTVSLVDGSLGTLHVGDQSGDSVTFSLGVAGTTTVDFETTAGGPWPKTVEFDIDANGGVTSVSATRFSETDNNCGGGGPPGGGGPGG